MNKYVSLDKRSKKAKRRSAKNSEMDLSRSFWSNERLSSTLR